jgi:F-type H+-transporting ATPase subunit delta
MKTNKNNNQSVNNNVNNDDMFEEFREIKCFINGKPVYEDDEELTDEQKARLTAKLTKVTGKTIKPQYVIDKGLIGGISVTVDGKHFDGSVRKNLKNIKEVIS